MATAFPSFGADGLIPQQSINLQTPAPTPTPNLNIQSASQALYDWNWGGWDIITNGSFQFNLSATKQQPVVISIFVLCLMGADYARYCPLNMTVNGNSLVQTFNPNNIDWASFQFIVPAHWVTSGNNTIVLSLDSSARNTLVLRSFGVEGLDPQPAYTTAVDFKETILNEFVAIDDRPYGGYTGFQTGVKSRLLAPSGIDVSANRSVIIRKSTAAIFAQFGGDDWYLEHLKITATRRNDSEVVILDQAVNTWIGLSNLTWAGTLTAVP